MERRPRKCPICGSKITRVTNVVTKNSYFKCSNNECSFVLGENYTDAEFNLQGTILKATCLKCNKPLVVVNGPRGLYPKCVHCSCDSEPTFYNGKMYPRWVNARRTCATEEIKQLVQNFNSKSTDDELYDFNAFITSKSVEKKDTQALEGTTNSEKILVYLMSDTTKPRSAQDISKATGAKIGSIRTSLLSLRTLKLIKIVDYTESISGNHTLLYQVTESGLPEIATFTKEEGYNSASSFLKDNVDKYGNIIRSKEKLMAGLKEANVKPILFQSPKGVCYGYAISKMESIMNDQSPVKEENGFKSSSSEKGLCGAVLDFLRKDTKKSYTIKQIVEKLGTRKDSLKISIKKLRASKKIKIVGWDLKKEGQHGAIALRYQVAESTLPKLKTTVDKNLYTTLPQFYRKKLQGKRAISLVKARKIANELTAIPLIINQRAYAGYSIADLREAFKDYVDLIPMNHKATKKSRKVTKSTVDIDVRTAVSLSEEQKALLSNHESEKKSIFSKIKSLFKKEKVLS